MKIKFLNCALLVVFMHVAAPVLAGEPTNSLCASAETATDTFDFSIAITNSAFFVGQPVVVKAYLKNKTTNSVPIACEDGLMDYSFQITTPDGNPAVTTEYGNRLMVPVAIFHQSFEYISPSHVRRELIPLSKTFVMTNVGEYRIVITRKLNNKEKITAGPLCLLLTNTLPLSSP